MPAPSLIVHGGAWAIHDDEVEDCLTGCRNAAQVGWEVLQNGGAALDAVEAAVRVLEDDPAFDAGRGSHLNTSGEVEMDAIIMDGATLNNGAVAAVQRVKNPISLARLVMERSGHSLLVGSGAEAFARSDGVAAYRVEELLVGRELARWEEFTRNSGKLTRPEITAGEVEMPTGTVGAVARDADGHLAAATSTGGTANKLPGRVGDSPLIGCGAYADDECGAASSTGWGESLMKIVFCKSACDLMSAGHPAQAAAEAIIKRLTERVDGLGGIILIDRQGNIGHAFNTPRMARAWVTADGEIESAV